MKVEFYNPEGFDAKKLEAHLGWRFLTVEEMEPDLIRPPDLQYFSNNSEKWTDSHRAGRKIELNEITYRTKTPLPGAAAPDDLFATIAKLVGA